MRSQYQSTCNQVNQYFCFTSPCQAGSLLIMEKYGERVKAARSYVGITQPQLSEKLEGKITQQGISYLESGDAYGSEFTVQIADICGVDPTWLATGKGLMIVPINEIIGLFKDNPDLLNLLKIAAPLTPYQLGVLKTTGAALAEQPKQNHNGTQ